MSQTRANLKTLGFLLLSVGLLVLLLAVCRARQAIPPLPTAACVRPDQQPGLALRWFGTSTLTISDGQTTIMIDGFFSRPGLFRLGLASTGLPLIRPDKDQLRLASQLLCDQPVDAIFVAHAHHDHALDTAAIAKEKKATVYGSDSAINVVCGQDTDGEIRISEIHDRAVVPVGEKFRVTVMASSHETNFFGPPGEVTRSLPVPARLRAFKKGASFAFLVQHPDGDVLIVPSAVMDGQGPALDGVRADVVLLGIGMLGRKPDATMHQYWTTVVCPTHASRVHLIHWDDFMRPLSEPLRPLPFDRVDNTVSVLSSLAKRDGIELSYLPLSTPVSITRSQGRKRCAYCPTCPAESKQVEQTPASKTRPDPPPVTQCGRAAPVAGKPLVSVAR